MKRAMIALAVILALSGVTYSAILFSRTYMTVESPQAIAVAQTPELDTNVIHELVNAERAKVGLQPLVRDARLDQSAQLKVNELALEGWDTEPHTRSDGKRGYSYVYDVAPEFCQNASENLAGYQTTSEGVVKDWMNSKTHREAILDTEYIYVGYARTDQYIAQHFCIPN